MASAPTGQPEDNGNVPTADLTMDEILHDISKRYSLIPKEHATQTPRRTKLENFLNLQGMTPQKSNTTEPVTSTPLAPPRFNMDPATPAYHVTQPATLAAFSQPLTYHPALPRIPYFSGDSPTPKGEVDYLVWRYEVQCLFNLPGLSSSQVLQIVRG